ncbi:polygalacturonase-like isoform X1 [Syzygium oleosum]|uniref:polygalacturonase-like isoform X1 n=1 Tax=Syzygium oleosum TaxID=219896 RepID=UPI0011D1AE03|nr:polygalacturonase-like isoform X1 [Syzygium oleosum]
MANLPDHLVWTLLFLLILSLSRASSSTFTLFDVLDFGADPTGAADSTQAFCDAWTSACGRGDIFVTILVRNGSYLLGPVRFGGPCKSRHVSMRMRGATLVAPLDYRVLGGGSSWLSFNGVSNTSIHGGVLDAKGPSLWACKDSGRNCPDGATTLSFTNSNNIRIKDLMSMDSQMFHISINRCRNVRIQGLRVKADGNSPNTDGIHVQLSTNVSILRSDIATGDDCISIGPGTQNLRIQGVRCGPGHGISIGSLARSENETGVQNIIVKNTTFQGTQNGLRIKSWARPSNGFVQGVHFINARMINAHNPIIIDQNYCPYDSQTCPNQESSVKISDVLYRGIQGTSATPVAVRFNCSAENPCTRIQMRNVHLTSLDDEVTRSSCANANGEALGTVQPRSCLYENS